ncbi:MAG: ComEC/Rec2 family competence protein, partial [Deltaproteobacteria bacterium]|nr:ComEC/Rec2 family competence protein [Deltaproteobacteria bacterium]
MADEHIVRSGAQSIEIERSRGTAARHLLLDTPPLYLSTAALIVGDALGNLHVFIPLWAAIAAAAVAAALFLFNRPMPGMVVAVLGLASAATLPLNHLLAPDFSSQTVRRFPDGAQVTLEGWVVREPEPQGGGRTYLSVNVQDGALSASDTASASGLVRVTAPGSGAFRVGDKVRVSGKIRFPRNDGDEDEFDYKAWLMRQGFAATIVALPPRLDLPIARAMPVPSPLCCGRGHQAEHSGAGEPKPRATPRGNESAERPARAGWRCASQRVRSTSEEERVTALSSPQIIITGHRKVFPDSLLQAVRERIAKFIDLTLQYPQNAEMRALIIGDRSGIDERLRQPFALTGMAHLLVISGLHLGFVA